MSVETKLDKILGLLESLDTRVKTLEDTLSVQQNLINTLGSTAIENFIVKANVEEACGVDPTKIGRNQLMGEVRKERSEEDLAIRQRRRAKQELGAKLYTLYCVSFAILMVASFMGWLPEFSFETSMTEFELVDTSRILGRTMHIPVILSVLYVVVVFGIQSLMKDKEPFGLKYPLALWSLLLGLFSLFGSLRTVPPLIMMVQKRGLPDSICGDTRRDWLFDQPAGYWTYIFILSKIPELIDTLFIVLRKRPLITLHWYHHITVMLFCWNSWATHCLSGIFFSAMNLTVHAFMYIFYCLAALGYRPTSYAMYITVIQILQMFVGTAITAYIFYHMTFVVPQDVMGNAGSLAWNLNVSLFVDDSPKCKINPGNALAGLAMYASYLWLFCVFFYYAYLAPKRRAPAQPGQDQVVNGSENHAAALKKTN